MITKKEERFRKNGPTSLVTPDEIVESHFGRVAALIGERSRAIMLWNLLDGKAHTATELALAADISKQACSGHLNLLLQGGILKAERQGRHRYFTFATDRAAQVVESIASLMPDGKGIVTRQDDIPTGIRYARTCYDHLAGRLGVLLFEAVVAQRLIVPKTHELTLTQEGETWFRDLSIDPAEWRGRKRRLLFACMDWSERKPHLAGALAAAMLRKFMDSGWVRPVGHSRELVITPLGEMELARILPVEFNR